MRNIRHFLAWLAINHGVTYSTDQSHLTAFLQVRLSEPCNRGSLKITHESFVFLDIVSGAEAQQRLTASQLYLSIYCELLSKALPGKPTKQAPRMFTKMLSCLEQLIMSSSFSLHCRIYAWWILVQSWATLRFDDHRGINPKSIKVDSTSFMLPTFRVNHRIGTTYVVAFGLKRSLHSLACRTAFSHIFVIFIMSRADDQVYDESTYAQEEADYESAVAATFSEGSNPQQPELPTHTAASPQVPNFPRTTYQSAAPTYAVQSQAASYQSATPMYAASGQVLTLQSQTTAQPSPGQPIATSFQFGQQRSSSTLFLGELGFTPQQVVSAPPLNLGLENLLRQCDVKEAVIQAFRVRGITDRLLFVALDDTTESLRSTCKEALGIDTSANFEHKLEFAKIAKAWSSTKIAAETKQKIDAIHRALYEPVQMLEGDWGNMIRAFKLKYGNQIHPSRLPGQSYYEAY